MIRKPSPRAALLAAAVVAVVGAGATGVVVLTAAGSPFRTEASGPVPHLAPAVVGVARATGDEVPWDAPLTVTATGGRLRSVTVAGADGTPLTGTLTGLSWTSATTLVPQSSYLLHVVLVNPQGRVTSYDRTVRASAATQVLRATISPDGGTYGVGQPMIVRFNRAVASAQAKLAVMARMTVTTTPATPGAWHWFNSFEVHYRGPAYWKPGTTVSVHVDLGGLRLPGTDTWGSTRARTAGMTIGDALVATVDVTAHTMTVRRNGIVVRVAKVSTGRDKYPTKGGVHIVLVREKEHLYDSSTVGIPTASPDGYYETLPWSVRISNGGAFVHANPGTVQFQGRLNVSHGCVNASVADAKWFYDNTHLGDVVDVIHAAVPPTLWDEGMTDWNYSWTQWQQGNLSA